MSIEESKLTEAKFQAFEGLNQSYIEMDQKLSKIAPKCHFRPMNLEHGDGEYYCETWWECSVCGHTKSR